MAEKRVQRKRRKQKTVTKWAVNKKSDVQERNGFKRVINGLPSLREAKGINDIAEVKKERESKMSEEQIAFFYDVLI